MKINKYRYLIFFPVLFCVNNSNSTTTDVTHIWEGFYIGTKAGAVFSQFNTPTVTEPGPSFNSIQANSINQIGNQSLNTNGFLNGIEWGYNWQHKPFVYGFDTSFQALSLNNLTNSGALVDPSNNNNQFVITSYANNNWLFIAKPKLGLSHERWLFYTTAGLGLSLLKGDFIFSNSLGSFESKHASQWKAGYVVGAGIETFLTEHLSLKSEYLYGSFNNVVAHTKNNYDTSSDQKFYNTINLKENIITLGVNYRFNKNMPEITNINDIFNVENWDNEIGTRFFVSSGTAGAPQPLLNTNNNGDILASRLIFSSLTSVSEEMFARIEHKSGLFMKGYLGSGSILNGHLNDEDFPALYAYSNTLSSAIGNLSYATVDAGYSFLNNGAAKVGAFVGYNYYSQNINVYGCKQIAGDLVCVPSGTLSGFLGLSEDDTFNSLRIGLSSQLPINNNFSINSDLAYIPVVVFDGLDMHNARQLVGPEHSNRGDGAMLETTLNYQLSDSWSAGLGGRYWMWNMRNGSVIFDFLGDPDNIVEPARFNTTRYGGFIQLNYRYAKPNNFETEKRINWQGLFIGGDLGGAWGYSYWSNPFPSSEAYPGYINVSGFGNNIQSTGPIGGGQIQYNWQFDKYVFGIASSINAANIYGENTLFSGLGGVNGQTKINYLATFVGRAGRAINDTLFYINSGPALLNINTQLNANTGDLALGQETQNNCIWGWTGGAGVEYAFNDNWTSNIEYDYVDFAKQNIKFNSIDIINNYSSINTTQSVNVFKLGLNYKIL